MVCTWSTDSASTLSAVSDSLVAAVRFRERDDPIWLQHPVPRGTEHLVLADAQGVEHHFGDATYTYQRDGTLVFTYLASYDAEGRKPSGWRPLAAEALRERGYTALASPEHGPLISPLVNAALNHLVDRCNTNNGFAFPEEKQRAVQTLIALREHGERIDAAEIEVWAATRGWRLDHAKRLRELAEQVRERRYFRPAIKLTKTQARKMVEQWREDLNDRPAA